MNVKKQINTRKRVAEHGEVFTSEREVNSMLDLVRQETERIESRFLEPACGNGNFLIEILRRKLVVVGQRYAKSALEYERYAILAVSSIYGIDILEDNVYECRKRLLLSFIEITKDKLQKNNAVFKDVARFILEKNIVCGDALTLNQIDGNPIVFSEWSLVRGSLFQRRDFTFAELIASHDKERNLFQPMLGYDEESDGFIPAPVKEYPLTHYGRLKDYE